MPSRWRFVGANSNQSSKRWLSQSQKSLTSMILPRRTFGPFAFDGGTLGRHGNEVQKCVYRME